MDRPEETGYELLLTELGRINSELAAQRRLSAEVAHDLANPAQVLLGLSELLLDYAHLDSYARMRVEQIERTALTMRSLVDDLRRGLELSPTQSLRTERADFARFVTSVVDRSRLLSSTKRISLVLESSLTGDTWVEVDLARLERALTNLIGNAIKFSPSHSSIVVRIAADEVFVWASVTDQGPGMSDEGRTRIFEVYHREPETAHVPGLGLGLHIARQIVEGHGGTIEVDSTPGNGATFTLRVPSLRDPDKVATNGKVPV